MELKPSLKGKTFTVYTKWEQVFDGDRYYGFVEMAYSHGTYLGPKLVEKGLVQMHIHSNLTPNGRKFWTLEGLEKAARNAKPGA